MSRAAPKSFQLRVLRLRGDENGNVRFVQSRNVRFQGMAEGPKRETNNSPKTQQLFFYLDLVHVFGVRFDKPWPTRYRGFHFLTKRTQVCAYAEVRQRPGQNSLAFLPYHTHTCWHFARSRPPTL